MDSNEAKTSIFDVFDVVEEYDDYNEPVPEYKFEFERAPLSIWPYQSTDPKFFVPYRALEPAPTKTKKEMDLRRFHLNVDGSMNPDDFKIPPRPLDPDANFNRFSQGTRGIELHKSKKLKKWELRFYKNRHLVLPEEYIGQNFYYEVDAQAKGSKMRGVGPVKIFGHKWIPSASRYSWHVQRADNPRDTFWTMFIDATRRVSIDELPPYEEKAKGGKEDYDDKITRTVKLLRDSIRILQS